MDLINDLGTDLALAFLVEKRFRQKIESKDAARLIGKIRNLLETDPKGVENDADRRDLERGRPSAAC